MDQNLTPEQIAAQKKAAMDALEAVQGRPIGQTEAGVVDAYDKLRNSPGGAGQIGLADQAHNSMEAARSVDTRDATIQNVLGQTNGTAAYGSGAMGAAVGGGSTQVATPINAGGFAGFFGQQKDYPIYVPGMYGDSTYAGNRNEVNAALAGAQNRPDIAVAPSAVAAGAMANGGVIDQNPQEQFRNQQMQLGNALMQQANGQGPSLAGAQLQQSTEQNLQAALAQAASARGGNLGAAQYAIGNARANIQQQAAQGLAQTRIQEQMAARSQLGDVLNSGRGADIGLALNQAQLGQQNNQFNAGQTQQNNQFNATQQQQNNQFGAGLSLDQQKQKDATVQSLMAMGYSLDQANYLSTIQQGQFGVNSIASQIGGANGISVQNASQGIQLGGAAIGAIGAAASSGASYLAARAGAGK